VGAKEAYHAVARQMNEDPSFAFKTFKSSLYRAKAAKYPKLPESATEASDLLEVVINEYVPFAQHFKRGIVVGEDKVALVFASDQVINFFHEYGNEVWIKLTHLQYCT
jgi:hypothetical protein